MSKENGSVSVDYNHKVEGLQRGDEAAWSELYGRPYNLFKNVVRRTGVPFGEIDDVIQDGMLRAHKGVGQLIPDQNPLPWLTTVMRNAAIDHQRKEGRRLQPLSYDEFVNKEGEGMEEGAISALTDTSPTPEEEYIVKEEAQEVKAQLKPREIVVFEMKAEGYGIKEIAQTPGLTENIVKQTTWRARDRLKTG
jgi:RNA polymerase sigma-70 factor (ECF subfamily)